MPIPAPPAISQALAVQNELVANIAKALTQASIILAVVNGAVALASGLLATVINKVSAICNSETFQINQDTKNAIDAINNEVASTSENEVTSTSESEFYQLINVSQDDIELREDLITQLQNDQRSLLDLLEAPSRVIIGINDEQPQEDQGKEGDYFINQTTRTIYGPKISDTTWPQGINY